ncbi:MAG: DUF4157 domain-containing protein [Ekhidna sp.]
MNLRTNKNQTTKSQSVAGHVAQRKANNTGIPDNLKSGIENLSGHSMDDVKVHYNSARPAQLQAHAFAQGNQIHLASGQEKHLPHEAWHVVQQKQGRVKPTMQLRSSVPVNDDPGLEKDADVMGEKALQMKAVSSDHLKSVSIPKIVQRKTILELNAFSQPRIGAHANLGQIKNNYATLVIRATHTGDMYHLKAARALFPNLNVLIWGVTQANNHATLNSAFQIASYINNQGHCYYTDLPKPTTGNPPTNQQLGAVTHGNAIGWHRWIDEGRSTSMIMAANENSGDHGATEKRVVREGTAPIGNAFQKFDFSLALRNHGFSHGQNYVLVNFRNSGHGAGTAPALDTGTTGYDEIIAQVRHHIPGATIVPMGDLLPAGGGPFPANLVDYWTWPGINTREKQAGLLRYLNENYNITGAVGMRSGIMDSLAFAGIKIVSIDISPTKQGNTSKGWERGSKLEKAYGTDYGRVFVKHQRVGETVGGNPWVGSFHAADRATIGTAVNNYLGTGAIAIDRKDASHPLSTHELHALINRVAGAVVPVPAAPLPAPVGNLLAQVERTRINKIRDLVTANYTHVPNAAAYRAILDNFLTFPTP